jgi:hypothetical protein
MATAWLIRLAAVMACAFAFTAIGWRLGVDHVEAGQAREAALIARTAEAVEGRTATAIAGIKVTRQTINGKVREIVREKTVYRDCLVDPDLQRLLDNARAGQAVESSN